MNRHRFRAPHLFLTRRFHSRRRAITIFGCSYLGSIVNKRKFDMPLKEQSVLYAGGLIRGAICWAQAIQVRDPHRHVMLSTTLGVILFTTLIIGSLLPWWVKRMEVNDDEGDGTLSWHAESPLRIPNTPKTNNISRDEEEVRRKGGGEAATILCSI